MWLWHWLVWQIKEHESIQYALVLFVIAAYCSFLYLSGDGEAAPRDCDPPDDSGYGWCYEPEPEPAPRD